MSPAGWRSVENDLANRLAGQYTPRMVNASPIRKEFCTMSEAAEKIGVSVSQVSRYVSAGLLTSEPVGGQKFLRWSEVKAFKRLPPGNPAFRGKKSG